MADIIKQSNEEVEEDDKEMDLYDYERIHKDASELLSRFIRNSDDNSTEMSIILKRNYPNLSNEDYQTVNAIKSIESNYKVIIKNLTSQMENTAKAYAQYLEKHKQ
jgi:hypothetical protein